MVMLSGLAEDFPILYVAAVLGFAVLAWLKSSWPVGVYAIAGALAVGIVAEYATPSGSSWLHGSGAGFGLADVVYKVSEYWYPYCLILPAAAAFDLAYRRLSNVGSIALLLILLMFPFSQRPELDMSYTEHSLAQEWSVDWLLAKQGWWGNTGDTRWAQSPAELELSKFLREEIRNGRITTATHIVHVTPNTIMWQDVLLYSVYTGIEDDLYLMHPDPTLGESSTSSSRLWPVSMLPAALAKNPPYIVVHNESPPWLTLPPAGYDEIFHDDGIRLFRRHDIARDSTVR